MRLCRWLGAGAGVDITESAPGARYVITTWLDVCETSRLSWSRLGDVLGSMHAE